MVQYCVVREHRVPASLLLMLLVVLAGCGFRLRGSGESINDIDRIAFSGGSPFFREQLATTFSQWGVTEAEDASYRLVFSPIETRTEDTSYSQGGQYERLYIAEVSYQLETADGIKLFMPMAVTQERSVLLNQNQPNAALGDTSQLYGQLNEQIALAVVRSIASLSTEALKNEEERARAAQVNPDKTGAQTDSLP